MATPLLDHARFFPSCQSTLSILTPQIYLNCILQTDAEKHYLLSQSTVASSQMTESPDVPSTPGGGHTDDTVLLWVDRYKPTSVKQIIGQQGDKSNAKKLLNWLTNWHKNLGKKPACK